MYIRCDVYIVVIRTVPIRGPDQYSTAHIIVKRPPPPQRQLIGSVKFTNVPRRRQQLFNNIILYYGGDDENVTICSYRRVTPDRIVLRRLKILYFNAYGFFSPDKFVCTKAFYNARRRVDVFLWFCSSKYRANFRVVYTVAFCVDLFQPFIDKPLLLQSMVHFYDRSGRTRRKNILVSRFNVVNFWMGPRPAGSAGYLRIHFVFVQCSVGLLCNIPRGPW